MGDAAESHQRGASQGKFTQLIRDVPAGGDAESQNSPKILTLRLSIEVADPQPRLRPICRSSRYSAPKPASEYAR